MKAWGIERKLSATIQVRVTYWPKYPTHIAGIAWFRRWEAPDYVDRFLRLWRFGFGIFCSNVPDARLNDEGGAS